MTKTSALPNSFNTFAFPKNLMRPTLILFLFILISKSNAQTVLFNNGTVARMNPGCIVFINDGDVKNNTGIIKNAGLFTIENDFINNDTATGGNAAGLYKVQGDFINNDAFIADQSKVLLYGDNQQITGSSVTTFYDLTLTGSGIKSQTIDARVTNTLDLGSLELATGNNFMHIDNQSANAIQNSGGFVSSTGNGRLAWATNLSSQYVYPVGSSLGTPRIRPVRITPAQAAPNVYSVRFANTDPSNEGYDRSIKAQNVCGINDEFYHLIDHTSGNTAASVAVYYNQILDGSWSGIGHWQNIPQWENTSTATTGTSGGYDLLSISNWSNYAYPAFALINFGQTATASSQGNTFTANPPGTAYQWYFNGNPIAGATSQTYTATESGNYYVVITYGNGCTGQSNILEHTYISVQEIEGLTNFGIYPNPGSEAVFVQADFATPTDISIQFTNVLGQQLVAATVLKHTTTLQHKIDVSQFANGIYFITLLSEKGRASIPFINN
ncbi:MAG: T9SS type A sorting domain-containing protein [Bacteroidia bacterium]